MLLRPAVLAAIWAVLTSAALARAQEEQVTQAPAAAGTLTKPPQILESSPPAYPPEAQAARLGGDVGLSITIGADGKVTEAKVIKPAGHGFDEAAAEAVRRYVFSPAEIDGKPAAVTFDYVLHFVPPKLLPPVAPLQAQPPSLTGTVREGGNRHPLAGVSVSAVAIVGGVEGADVTDEQGHFSLRLPPGTYRVRAIEANHQENAAVETIKAGEVLTVTYFLRPKSVGLFETVVVGQREQREVTRYTFGRQELETTPGAFGDPIRVLQDLPGVARAPLFLGQLLVRGSGPNDTGTYIDGVELPLLFHFLAGPSVVNPEFVEKLDFYTGGFGGEYGRAIGGLVDIETRKPDPSGVHGSASINLLDSAAYVSVPIGPDFSVSAAGRRSYYDLFVPFVLKALGSNEIVLPIYDDYQLRADYHVPGTPHHLQLFFFGSDDSLFVTSANGSANAPSITDNTSFWRLEAVWRYDGPKLKSKAQVWVGTNDMASGIPGSTTSDDELVGGARERLEFDIVPHLAARMGLDSVWTHASVNQNEPAPPASYRVTPGQNELVPPEAVTNAFIHSDTAVWGELTWDLPKGFKIIPSVRADVFEQVDHLLGAFDPRLTVRDDFDLFGASAIKAAVGLYHEPAYPFEISPVTGTPDLPLQQAFQTSLGIEHSFTDYWKLELTGFFNYYSNLAEAPGGLNASLIGALFSSFFGAPTTQYVPNGSARAYGVEVLLRHQLSRHFYGWLAYTFSYSLLDDPELPGAAGTGFHPSPYDERHVLTLVGQYRFSNGWQIGARFRLASGLPITPPIGATFESDSQSYAEIPGPYNSGNLPLFQQLDLRVDKEWIFSRWSFGLYLDIENVYNAQNVELVTYNYNYSQTTTITGIPFLPTLGVQGRF